MGHCSKTTNGHQRASKACALQETSSCLSYLKAGVDTARMSDVDQRVARQFCLQHRRPDLIVVVPFPLSCLLNSSTSGCGPCTTGTLSLGAALIEAWDICPIPAGELVCTPEFARTWLELRRSAGRCYLQSRSSLALGTNPTDLANLSRQVFDHLRPLLTNSLSLILITNRRDAGQVRT